VAGAPPPGEDRGQRVVVDEVVEDLGLAAADHHDGAANRPRVATDARPGFRDLGVGGAQGAGAAGEHVIEAARERQRGGGGERAAGGGGGARGRVPIVAGGARAEGLRAPRGGPADRGARGGPGLTRTAPRTAGARDGRGPLSGRLAGLNEGHVLTDRQLEAVL